MIRCELRSDAPVLWTWKRLLQRTRLVWRRPVCTESERGER